MSRLTSMFMRWPQTSRSLAPFMTHYVTQDSRHHQLPCTSARSVAFRHRCYSTATDSPADTTAISKPTLKQRIADMIKKYGKLAVATHFAISGLIYSGIFVCVDYGVDVQPLLDSIGLQAEKVPPKASALIASYVVYKAATPIRLPVSFVAIPLVSRFIYPPKEKEENELHDHVLKKKVITKRFEKKKKNKAQCI